MVTKIHDYAFCWGPFKCYVTQMGVRGVKFSGGKRCVGGGPISRKEALRLQHLNGPLTDNTVDTWIGQLFTFSDMLPGMVWTDLDTINGRHCQQEDLAPVQDKHDCRLTLIEGSLNISITC